MRHLPDRWNAIAVVLALATMLGCQGLSTAKPVSQGQGTQNPLPGALSAAPANISFENVQAGTSQTQSGTLSNTGGTSLTITQAVATGTGFSTSGLTLPLTLASGQSTAFSVTFAPQFSGSFDGGIAIASNASNPSLSVTLSGSAFTQSQGTQGQVEPRLGRSLPLGRACRYPQSTWAVPTLPSFRSAASRFLSWLPPHNLLRLP
jgi:hypothetical protein